jgi:sugar fermentation stimulation protein A
MQLPPLKKGTLLGRSKRFISEIELDDGEVILAHCPNTGRMLGCSEPGRPVYVSQHDNPRRRMAFTWELIQMETSLVGVNTMNTNRIVRKALESESIPKFARYDTIVSEVKITSKTRIDFMLQGHGLPPWYIEVKNCTLVESGRAMFPDAVSTRGQKHLQELMNLKRAGHNAAVLFLVQRTDARGFSPARHIDREYSSMLVSAREAGVNILVYDVKLDTSRIILNRELPLILN